MVVWESRHCYRKDGSMDRLTHPCAARESPSKEEERSTREEQYQP